MDLHKADFAYRQGVRDALEERALRRDVYKHKSDAWWDHYLIGYDDMMQEMYGEEKESNDE